MVPLKSPLTTTVPFSRLFGEGSEPFSKLLVPVYTVGLFKPYSPIIGLLFRGATVSFSSAIMSSVLWGVRRSELMEFCECVGTLIDEANAESNSSSSNSSNSSSVLSRVNLGFLSLDYLPSGLLLEFTTEAS